MLHPMAAGNGPPTQYGKVIADTLNGLGGVAWLPALVAAVFVPWETDVSLARAVRAAAADPCCPVHLAMSTEGWLFVYLEHGRA
jgi:hypothetical protein